MKPQLHKADTEMCSQQEAQSAPLLLMRMVVGSAGLIRPVVVGSSLGKLSFEILDVFRLELS